MVCATEFQCFVWFCLFCLCVCLQWWKTQSWIRDSKDGFGLGYSASSLHDGLLRCCSQVNRYFTNVLKLGRELEVPLDVTTEAPPDAPPLQTDYAQAAQKRLGTANDLAREHLNKAAIRQKRNYDKWLVGKPYTIGDSVWLHNVRRKKRRNGKLGCPWEGPYLVISVLPDVVYCIQKSAKAKPNVIHADRLSLTWEPHWRDGFQKGRRSNRIRERRGERY